MHATELTTYCVKMTIMFLHSVLRHHSVAFIITKCFDTSVGYLSYTLSVLELLMSEKLN